MPIYWFIDVAIGLILSTGIRAWFRHKQNIDRKQATCEHDWHFYDMGMAKWCVKCGKEI